MVKFDAALAVDLIERHRITTVTATPTMLARIARLPDIDRRDFSSLVWVQQGAASFPPALVRTWIDLIGGIGSTCDGMTERLGLTAIRGDEWVDHPGSIGQGFRGTRDQILDERQLDRARSVRWARSTCGVPTTGKYGYLGEQDAPYDRATALPPPGDLGRLDSEGYSTSPTGGST